LSEAPERHVRTGGAGSPYEHPATGTRPDRHEAPLLEPDTTGRRVRLRGQGPVRGRLDLAAARLDIPGQLPVDRLGAVAGHCFRRPATARAGQLRPATRRPDRARALLGAPIWRR